MRQAFIALLPEEERAQHQKVVVRPRASRDDDVPAIEAEGLTRRFGDFTAVDHVSFRIGRGEIFGFLGSNGSGKSTTMKMLTGLLPATSGTAKLFGQPMGSNDMEARRNVGYMSQAFSLYNELTVRQNLELHAQLYHLPGSEVDGRVKELLQRYDLEEVADARPESLPLGIKQRLQLAVAVLHRPAMLILDEPTSGVDPVARDGFWRTLIDLSRDDGVTIFISTHFMNEADRCDRISLMHAGKVLAIGAPEDLVRKRGSASLEDAFISYLSEASGITLAQKVPPAAQDVVTPSAKSQHSTRRFDPGRLWAYARRETMELLRDPIRLTFALLGPLILMIAFGYGISLDVEHLRFGAFDQDRTPESRDLIEAFSSNPRYFEEKPPPIGSSEELDRRFRSGDLQVAVEIPPAFGRDLKTGRAPDVAVWLDGSMPFRAETTKGYVTALAAKYLLAQQAAGSSRAAYPGQFRNALSLQPVLRKRQRNGAERDHADADVDPGDHVHHRSGARERDRLDRQLLFDADYQVRVPVRQAAALHCRGYGQLRAPVDARGLFVRRAGQGILVDAGAWHFGLCGAHRRASANLFRPSRARRSRRCSPPS